MKLNENIDRIKILMGLNEEINKMKNDIDFIFNRNPELFEIGTKDKYSTYLSSIFPNSQVSDIVYHRTKSKTPFEKFDLSFAKEFGDYGKGFYFAPMINIENVWNTKTLKGSNNKIIPAKLNIVNPFIDPDDRYNIYYEEFIKENPDKSTDDYVKFQHDGIIDYYDSEKPYRHPTTPLQYVVYDANKIHILGSNKDIFDFKNYLIKTK